jgi:hypothetical protein
MRSGDRGGWVARSQPVLGTQRQGDATDQRDVAYEIEIELVVRCRVDRVARTASISLLSLSMISGGVFLGAPGPSAEDALYLAESSSAALRAASLLGFLILSQYGDRPEI